MFLDVYSFIKDFSKHEHCNSILFFGRFVQYT